MKYTLIALIILLGGCVLAPDGGDNPTCDFNGGIPDGDGVVTCNMDYTTKFHAYQGKTIDFECLNGYVSKIKWTLSSPSLRYVYQSNEDAKACAAADNQALCKLKITNVGPTNHHVTTNLIACTGAPADIGGDTPVCNSSYCSDMDYKTKLHAGQTKTIKFGCDPNYISAATFSTSTDFIFHDNEQDFKECLAAGYNPSCGLAFTNPDPFDNHHVTTKTITCTE